MTRFALLPCLLCALVVAACGNRLDGTLNEEEVGEFADGVYFELRYVDEGITYHDLTVWLMPMEDSCSVFPALLVDLEANRDAIAEQSLDAETYCANWEAIWAEHMGGLDSFWMATYRLRAQPRDADGTIPGEYPWFDRNRVNDFPVFDADIARYSATTFAACAEEFEGNALYAATVSAATAGALEVTKYTEDDTLNGRVEVSVDTTEGGSLSGTFETEFCPGAQNWPLEFGLGL